MCFNYAFSVNFNVAASNNTKIHTPHMQFFFTFE